MKSTILRASVRLLLLGICCIREAQATTRTPSEPNILSIGYAHGSVIQHTGGNIVNWGVNDADVLGNAAHGNQAFATRCETASDRSYRSLAKSMESRHVLAITNQGTLFAWGSNSQGQLGTGSSAPSNWSKAQVGTDNKWKSAATGLEFSVGLKNDGTLWAWGRNAEGQLGIGSTANRNVPAQITVTVPNSASNDWISVSAGEYHVVALKANGTLWTWGKNASGQLGLNSNTNATRPTQVTLSSPAIGPNLWSQVSAGSNSTAALTADGAMWTWGSNYYGQLGRGAAGGTVKIPAKVNTSMIWRAIGSGYGAHFGIRADGCLFGMGLASEEMHWDPSFAIHAAPYQIGFDNDWITVAGGYYFSMGVKTDGSIWGWGLNFDSQLGLPRDQAENFQTAPRRLMDDEAADAVGKGMLTGGKDFTLMLSSSGTIQGWGQNAFGQLGDGTNSPNLNVGRDNREGYGQWMCIAAGTDAGAGIRGDGTLWTWGNNGNGVLGLNKVGGSYNVAQPVNATSPASSSGKWVQVSAHGRNFIALKADGTVWVWGRNANGEAGDNLAHNPVILPKQVPNAGRFVAIAIGSTFAMALRADGVLLAWGDNSKGQVGDSSTAYRGAPTRVKAGSAAWVAIEAQDNTGMAIRSNGALYSWGDNGQGQAGLNSTNAFFNAPAVIGSDTRWAILAGGARNGWALKVDGSPYGWGYNATGSVGNNTTGTPRRSPVAMTIGGQMRVLGCGSAHCLAISGAGYLYGAGENGGGQLATGSTGTGWPGGVFIANDY